MKKLKKNLKGRIASISIDSILQNHLVDAEEHLSRLLDQYLDGDFPKDLLHDRKVLIEKSIRDLKREKEELSGQIESTEIIEAQLVEIEAFCELINEGLEVADFEAKRRIIDLPDVRGKLALENEEKIVYVSCKILTDQQRLSVALTSRWLETNHLCDLFLKELSLKLGSILSNSDGA